MSDISQRAAELARQNPPGVVLENLFLGVFAVMGMVLGRLWFWGSKFVFIIGLAFADGYMKGAKVQARPPEAEIPPPPQSVPAPPLMNDGRTMNMNETPFGVPFGPNVHAWSERG